MYLWKCWRENRLRFIGSLITLPGVCILFTVITCWSGGRNAMWKGTPQLWSLTTEAILGVWASLFTVIWGLLLGAASVGDEFQQGTADFLLARPRRRRYWVWVGWSAGICEISMMLLLAVGATFGTLTYLTGHVLTWRPLATILPLAVGGAVVYGLAFFMTLVARNGRQGLSYGMGLLFIDLLLPVAAEYYWKVHLPSVMSFVFAACKWAANPTLAFPLGQLVLYTVVALAFPLAAQLVLERAEV